MSTCPLFVDLCCGSAAVALRLLGGPNARPPISYMGSKRGYAGAILAVLGLRSGQGAGAVVLVEAGPWAKAWRLLTTPAGCRRVAEVIRGWIGEDARALWERLRAEPVPADEAEAVGAWCCLQHGNVGAKAVSTDGARWQTAGYAEETEAALERGFLARLRPDLLAGQTTALSSLRWPPVQVVEGDVAGVDPAEVAKWLWLQARTCNSVPVFVEGGEWRMCEKRTSARRHIAQTHVAEYSKTAVQRNAGDEGGWGLQYPETLALRAESCRDVLARQPVVLSTADVSSVEPGKLPPGTMVYLDPPYQGCTGYAKDLTRPQVLDVARRWSDAGATVCVSEAEPLPLGEGWHHVEITDCRVGQKRTFSRQKREFLTLNREPSWVPSRQASLFSESFP